MRMVEMAPPASDTMHRLGIGSSESGVSSPREWRRIGRMYTIFAMAQSPLPVTLPAS